MYMYYDKLDISIHNVDIQKFFIFYVIEKHFVFHYNGEDKLKIIF